MSVYTLHEYSKVALFTIASPIFLEKKDNVLTWSQNQKPHRQGKGGLNRLHSTIHPCLTGNENCPCQFSSLPSRFFLRCKWVFLYLLIFFIIHGLSIYLYQFESAAFMKSELITHIYSLRTTFISVQ